jgi:hypothetical protein
MPWYGPVVLRMVVTSVALPRLVKPLAAHPARAPLLALPFAGAVALARPAALLLGQATLHLPIAAVGVFTGLAAYAYGRAIDLSLSRTALGACWDDLLAMGLSSRLLQEGPFLHAWRLTGIGLSVVAVILCTVHDDGTRSASPQDQAPVPRVHVLSAGLDSVMRGLGVFFMRAIGLQDIGLARFFLNGDAGAGMAAGRLVLTFRVRMPPPRGAGGLDPAGVAAPRRGQPPHPGGSGRGRRGVPPGASDPCPAAVPGRGNGRASPHRA